MAKNEQTRTSGKMSIEGAHGPHRIYFQGDHIRIVFYPVVRHNSHLKVPANTTDACLKLICRAYDLAIGDYGRHIRTLLEKTDPEGEKGER